ncbi:MAG: hypothetical protein C4K58_07355 [Flavobacteriaceae bacterium]|nr:MAG: hypothetical protein C4K58_07355 [Flavobacteriaceae bacterium]
MIQFLGFLFFLTMFLLGFWGIISMATLAITWVILAPLETAGKIGKGISEEEVKSKTLPNQPGVELVYSK